MQSDTATLIARLHAVKHHIIGYDEATGEVKIQCRGADGRGCRNSTEPFRIEITERQLFTWLDGKLIQCIAPELSPDDCELLISGTCPICWEEMFR